MGVDSGDQTITAESGRRVEDPASADTLAGPPSEATPLVLERRERGRYQRGPEIARGGMGRIVAVRDLELGRDLAIKELLSPAPALEARFAREIAITARLSHPAIISVIEAGRWPSGEPFFVMRRVEGRSLKAALADAGGLDQRLAILPHVIAVADAVAYAHERGVIHRDLKPSNVLVGSFGDTVVIDWGLAKSRDDADPVADLPVSSAELTAYGSVMGTPAYMPPEQARGEPVDERADVYALGAILYQLLAGMPPFADTEVESADELLERVRDQRPTSIAALERGAPADLVSVVERAMQRDPSRRYRSAASLAEDLHRFQTGQLVKAHHYSRPALVARWLRRHLAAVVVAAIAALALAGLGGASFAKIAGERDRAESERNAALAARADAEDLLEFMVRDLQGKLREVGRLDVLEIAAHKAGDYYRDNPVDRSSTRDVARRVHALRNIAEVLQSQGKLAEALATFDRAIELIDAVLEGGESKASWQVTAASSWLRSGNVLLQQGELKAAAERYRRAVDHSRRAVEIDPDDLRWSGSLAESLRAMARIHRRRGELERAAAVLGEARALILERLEREPDNLHALDDMIQVSIGLGDVASRSDRSEEALAHYRRCLAAAERRVELQPKAMQWRDAVGVCRLRLGDALYDLERYDEAERQYRAQLALATELVETDPTNAGWQDALAFAHARLGDLHEARGQHDRALAALGRALEIRDKLLSAAPDDADQQSSVGTLQLFIGDNQLAMKRPREAAAAFEKSLAIFSALLARDGDNARARMMAIESFARVARARRALGDRGGAAAALARCRELGDQAAKTCAD